MSSNRFALFLFLIFVVDGATTSGWSSNGGNPSNDRRASIKPGNPTKGIPSLGSNGSAPDFAFSMTGRGSTPAITSNLILVTTDDGWISAFDSRTGTKTWSKNFNVDYYGGNVGDARSISTPTMMGAIAVVCVAGPADVLTIDVQDGHLIWKVTLDDHPYAAILSSGTISRNVLYVGTSFNRVKAIASSETAATTKFRGGFYAFNLRLKKLEWSGPWSPFSGFVTTDLYADATVGTEGFYGVDVIASTPPVDEEAKTVFFVTGPLVVDENVVARSQSIVDLLICLDTQNATSFDVELGCLETVVPTLSPNAIVALNATNGDTMFAIPMSAKRSWEAACENRLSEDEVCPSVPFYVSFPEGPFGDLLLSNPALWVSSDSTAPGKSLVVSEKTGVVWNIDATTGSPRWASKTCPGGHWGGVAVNPVGTICASCVNEHHQAWALLNAGLGEDETSYCGGWVGIDAISGVTSWTTPDPACDLETPFEPTGTGRSATAFSIAPPASVLNGFVVASASARYVPDSATGVPTLGAGGGFVYVLEEKTGTIVSSFETGTSICQGVSSDSDKLYVALGCDPQLMGGVLSDGNMVLGWRLKIF